MNKRITDLWKYISLGATVLGYQARVKDVKRLKKIYSKYFHSGKIIYSQNEYLSQNEIEVLKNIDNNIEENEVEDLNKIDRNIDEKEINYNIE